MATFSQLTRQPGCLRSLVTPQSFIQSQISRRSISTAYTAKPEPVPFPANLPKQFLSQLPGRFKPRAPKTIKIIAPPPSACKKCPDPLNAVKDAQLAVLDPTGERRALFDYRRSERSARVGDVLRVTFKNGDPFNGVLLSIKLDGIDTSFLLRNELTKVGVEMSVKAFSPNVESVEIVKRTEKRKRRARLFYMRKPKHDMRSVENIVTNYLRQKSALTGQRSSGKRK
ncbi:translation protein SH3-like domain-containing protein [Aspergillus granulosus]|uniref:Translation protein SH3-like domain-containing protein n=1 Tax=Aspergillus granulosus TaxID=176169 RepID=A0ABR4H2R8_9EURO